MEHSNYLAAEKTGTLLRRFALPCICSLIISCLYNIVDQIFVGNGVGYLGNAATGVIFPITVIGWGLSLFFGDGAAAALSVSLGRGETEDIHRSVGGAVLCSFLSGVVVSAIAFLWGDSLLLLIGATQASLQMAHDYGVIIFAMMPLAMTQNTLASIIRADSSPNYAMGAMLTQISIVIITVVNNILLVRYGAVSQYGADIPLAAFVVIMKLFQIVLNIAIGIAAGAQPIVGYNYGAKRCDRVRELLGLMLKWTVLVGLVCTLLFEAAPGVFIRMFGSADDPVYFQFAVLCLRIYLALILVTCVQKVCAIFLQSIGRAKAAAPLAILRDVLAILVTAGVMVRVWKELGQSRSDPVQRAISAQSRAIQQIAQAGSCVLIGRSADYVLRNYKDVVRIFIHAPRAYREKKVMEMYGDSPVHRGDDWGRLLRLCQSQPGRRGQRGRPQKHWQRGAAVRCLWPGADSPLSGPFGAAFAPVRGPGQ